jgi:caffeoyl-CoA O-methyltransferase
MGETIGVSEAVRSYVQRVGVREHPALRRCREETAAALPEVISMQISPEQGAFMQVLARSIRARRAVEVGVFTGYSALVVALAMNELHGRDARLVACDLSDDYVSRARSYWAEAGVGDIIETRIAPAADSLAALLDEGQEGAFDLAFIDADKTGYDAYYELCLRLLRPGGLMLLDNMLREGAVADPANTEPATVALRALAAKIRDDQRVDMTLTTVGDGLSLVVKR